MQIDFKNKVFIGSDSRKSVFDCSIPNDPKGVIIFAHGYKGYKDWGAWGLMEAFFLKHQFGFVKFNFSHNGGTVTDPIDFPDLEAFGKNRYSYEVNDLNLIIDETDRMIREECGLDTPIYLMGHSRGGGIAVLTAEQNDKIKKLISLAGISDIASRFLEGDALVDWKIDGVTYVKNGRTNQEMPHFYSFYEDYIEHTEFLSIERAAEALKIPFLQIHGDMDLAVSISEGQSVAHWTGTRLSIIKGAGHTFGSTQPWGGSELPEDLEMALGRALEFFETD